MATKTKAVDVEKIVQPPYPDADCQHLIFSISNHPVMGKSVSLFDANEKINNWLRTGYKIKTAQAMSIEPGVVNVFILLVKDEPA